MRPGKHLGFCCVTAVLGFVAIMAAAGGEAPPAEKHAAGNAAAKAASKTAGASANAAQNSAPSGLPSGPPSAAYLVREVVYNELHDHDTHGYWKYWIERQAGKDTQVEEDVETPEGPVARLESTNGRPVAAEVRDAEDGRLQRLLSSASERAQHRKDYTDDERRIGRILGLLPDAFVFEPAQVEARSDKMPECTCYHMRFHPNPDYPAHSVEARVFHAMAGDLWIGVDQKRLVRLEGKLQENVDFGYGILGRLYKDGWFRLERAHVGATPGGAGDWKTQRLEVHLAGRAMLFKTIARETSEVRGGFERVPSGLSLAQAAALIGQTPRQTGGLQAASLANSR